MRSIDPSLLSKINSQNQTIYNNANPKMRVAVARAKTTIMDYTYWTVEIIRQKPGLGDISLAPRRFKVKGPPNRIYEIHVDNGVVGTAIREYPDKLKIGWQNQFTLGTGSNVAIAFNGHWERYRKLWRLVTDVEPWIVWVDGNNKLQAQHWDDETSKLELSTGISSVRALRGWKNATLEYLDQGIVVAYIKTDGTVWYRNYADQTDGTIVWEYEKQLTEFTGTAVSLNLFITNDYRIGFIIGDSTGKFFWYITDRNWAGMASPLEFIGLGIADIEFAVYEIEYKEAYSDENITTGISDFWFNIAGPIYPEVVSVENPEGSEIQLSLKFNYEIAPDIDLTAIKNAFTITDSLSTEFFITTTEVGINRAEILFNMPNFSSASGNMFIDYDRAVLELDCLNEGSRFIIESFNFEFTPDLEPPIYQTEENITVGIIDLAFDVSEVSYINAFREDNIEVGIADISFVVTKIADIPL